MKIGSLFSGAGGLDMAVERALGARTVWHCELDPSASKVLAHRWPGVPNLGDITAVDWSTVEPVDILAGGFPCQDVSAAGRRAGIAEGTRSGLWAIYAEAINQLRPRLVVIENVRGLLSATAHRAMESAAPTLGNTGTQPVLRALGAVLGDLADIGYDAQWTTIAASAVGAPHRRERVFIVAHPAGKPWRIDNGTQLRAGWGAQRPGPATGTGSDADPARDGRHEGRPESARIGGRPDVAVGGHGSAADAHNAAADGERAREEPRERGSDAADTASQRGADITRRGDTAGQHVLAVAGASDRDRPRRTTSGVSELGGTTPELATLTIGCVCWEHLTTHSGHCCWRDEPSDGWPDDEPPCGHRHLGDGGPRRDGLCPTCSEAQRLGLSSWSCPDPNMCGGGHVDLLPTPSAADGGGGHLTRSGDRSHELLLPGVARAYSRGELLSTPQARDYKGIPAEGFNVANLCRDVADEQNWGKYSKAIHRWESMTRPAPAATETNSRGNQRLSAAFPEWMMGWPAGWVTEVPGISRNDQLRIIGNGVVPQQAAAALRWLLSIEVAA